MCGWYSLIRIENLKERFSVRIPAAGLRPRFNVAPGTEVPVIVAEDSERRLEAMRWGLVPSWAADPSVGRPLVNARAETLAEKPSFRGPLQRSRCLIPADGFFEWRERQPFYFRRTDGELFAFAGLFDEWQHPGGSPLRTCTIVTTEPNAVVRPVHGRMPAILRPDHEAVWLGPSSLDAGALREVLAPYLAEMIEGYPVSAAVNDPAREGEEAIRPVKRWW
jgi:putative SOS response-associated peptidase YedK